MEESFPAMPTTKRLLNPRTRTLAAAVGLIGLVSLPVALLVLFQRAASTRTLRPGERVPILSLKDVSSKEASLVDFAGQRIAVLFFSVDCPHCQKEIAYFNQMQKMFANDIVFLAVSLSDPRKTVGFMGSNRLTTRTLLDENGEARRAFGIEEVPALFLVNKDQTIKHREFGERSPEALMRLLGAFSRDGVQ